MPRVSQAVAFFALLGTSVHLVGPSAEGTELFGVLLTGLMVSVLVVYVLPWAYFGLETDPFGVSESE